jgi:DNA-binding protein HU-beta
MNKSELAVKLAKKVGLTHAKAADVVDAIFNAHKGIVAVELDAGRKVTVPGFGTFATRKRSARQGRNPATGNDHHPCAQVRHVQGWQDAQGEGRKVSQGSEGGDMNKTG